MRAGLIAAALFVAASGTAQAKDPPVSFSEDIHPILQIRCQSCHQPGGDGYEKSGFDVRTYEGVMKGTTFGPMVVPGDPTTSNLLMLMDGKVKGLQMPHGKRKLSTCDRDLIRSWIKAGAKNN